MLGGLIIGVSQVFATRYQPDIAPWLGRNFGAVMPYLAMVAILLIRPYGLFGEEEVRRICPGAVERALLAVLDDPSCAGAARRVAEEIAGMPAPPQLREQIREFAGLQTG